MIRWITDRLGTAPANDPGITADMALLDVRHLVDKSGNPAGAAREMIDAGARLLGEGRRLVVCCDYGISRSNAIAAGVLSVTGAIPLDRALREVMDKTGENEIKLEPLQAVRAALRGLEGNARRAGRRILVTGGSGFLGEIFQARSRASIVAVPTREEVDLASGALALDLLVREEGINCIVHLANPRVYTSNLAVGQTVTMLRNVLEVCRENGIRLIYPSSWEVYAGYRSSELIAGDDLPLYPKGPLGEAKALCEYLIEQHRKLYGTRCAVVRSSTVYGETGSRPRFLWNFITKAQNHQPIATHNYQNGLARVDLLHADDFAAAVHAAVEAEFSGNINIGSGVLVSTRHIAEAVAARTASRSAIVHQSIEGYASNVAMDNSRARQLLKWEPEVALDAGIDRVVAAALGPQAVR